jgi:hypothetical protein
MLAVNFPYRASLVVLGRASLHGGHPLLTLLSLFLTATGLMFMSQLKHHGEELACPRLLG